MDNNAWLIKMDLETSGLTVKIPDMLYNAIGGVLPIRNVTVDSLGYAALVDADKFGGKARSFAKKFNDMMAKVKAMYAKAMNKAAEIAKKIKAATDQATKKQDSSMDGNLKELKSQPKKTSTDLLDVDDTTAMDDVNTDMDDASFLQSRNSTDAKPPNILDILGMLGMKKDKIQAMIEKVEKMLGGFKIIDSLNSFKAHANSTMINISGALLFKKSYYKLAVSAQDFSNPTQKQKEAICQPRHKVLGMRIAGGLGLLGKKGSMFNTLDGVLKMKARYKSKRQFELGGKYNGRGGIAFGKGTMRMGLSLKYMSANFERSPDVVTVLKNGTRWTTEGGLRAHILARAR
jgi:hypothetical protein